MGILNEDEDVRLKIGRHVVDKGIKVTVLAEKVGRSSSHLHFVFKAARPLTDELLEKLNLALGTSFKKEKKKIAEEGAPKAG